MNVPALQDFLTRYHLLIFLDLLQPGHYHSNSSVVKLWSASATKHLHDFKIRVFFHALARIGGRILDDHKVTWQIDANRKRACATYYVKISIQKTSLDSKPIILAKTSVMEANSS